VLVGVIVSFFFVRGYRDCRKIDLSRPNQRRIQKAPLCSEAVSIKERHVRRVLDDLFGTTFIRKVLKSGGI